MVFSSDAFFFFENGDVVREPTSANVSSVCDRLAFRRDIADAFSDAKSVRPAQMVQRGYNDIHRKFSSQTF